ncbi:AP2-associated kinase [Talaromyces islandicus]|uniref:non-specific serine/threonine protein kinase n=1 Tax=Talaromyces islandicus TaxID=28573 RepID=A0A0U1LSS5_TALIS|nr:AP2-associated kinase [Talaromyces islandicus]
MAEAQAQTDTNRDTSEAQQGQICDETRRRSWLWPGAKAAVIGRTRGLRHHEHRSETGITPLRHFQFSTTTRLPPPASDFLPSPHPGRRSLSLIPLLPPCCYDKTLDAATTPHTPLHPPVEGINQTHSMSSYNTQAQARPPQSAHPPHHGSSFNPAVSMGSSAPAGTFVPGTKVQVGNHRVVIEKYLSEGGFAHVYVVRLPQPIDGAETGVLKRVAVPDKTALAGMRTEVETMKKLKGHRHIVKYMDSHASQLKGGGYEVFLLMENCQGGGLIDFMNTRLQHRLTEPEIIKIFSDVAEGVACMHYLKPPLLHRDLKVENVLISLTGKNPIYKLCDFGSAAPPRPAATSGAEGRLIEDDIQRHTTMQYRSPEMIDVYRKQPIDEKSDIWALGVLLYKLCYYTTPFEEVGQMAILNASYKFPSYPTFSDRLKRLIASMLQENPQRRPTIYEALKEACSMQGKEVPIRDIYAHRTQSEARRQQELPPSSSETPRVGAVFSPPMQETQIIPEIAPMRRGRPTKTVSQQNSARPSPSPYRGTPSNDPFAVLDGGKSKSESADELSARFPTLDQFSLLHEKGGKFDFEPSAGGEAKPESAELSQRVTNALADDAFVKPASPALLPKKEVAESQPPVRAPSVDKKPKESPSLRGEPDRAQSQQLQDAGSRKPQMVSTGTMTESSSPSPSVESRSSSNRPIYRFPQPSHERRQSGQPWSERNRMSGSVPSQTTTIDRVEPKPKPSSERISQLPTTSARPSMEASSRPSLRDLDEAYLRPKSANSRSRPSSVHIAGGNDFPGDKGFTSSAQNQYEDGEPLQHARTDGDWNTERSNIGSDVDYLRAREEEELARKKEKRLSSGSMKHAKRSSLSSFAVSGRGLLSGRFGEAFRRFEQNTSDKSRTPSPNEVDRRLTPIEGSEATDRSDDGYLDADRTDISPEMRREMERRQLSQEEKRVANAAAEYRLRVSGRNGAGGRDGVKAAAIQNKVQSLLQENTKSAPKTASGYGKYTEPEPGETGVKPDIDNREYAPRSFPARPKPPPKDIRLATGIQGGGFAQPQATTEAASPSRGGPQRPMAPPKPKNLRTGPTGNTPTSERPPPGSADSAGGEDWEKNFSRRYPSLSGLELVETEIDVPKLSSIRTREV